MARAQKLVGEARAAALAGLEGWSAVEGRDAIEKKYVFSDFAAAFAWMTRVAIVAEKTGYHANRLSSSIPTFATAVPKVRFTCEFMFTSALSTRYKMLTNNGLCKILQLPIDGACRYDHPDLPMKFLPVVTWVNCVKLSGCISTVAAPGHGRRDPVPL